MDKSIWTDNKTSFFLQLQAKRILFSMLCIYTSKLQDRLRPMLANYTQTMHANFEELKKRENK